MNPMSEDLKKGLEENFTEYTKIVNEIKSSQFQDAMYPKHVIDLKKVEADLGPVIEDSKPTNPKDAIGSDKLPLHLVPSVLNIYASLAFLEGAAKYGCYNWRVAGVRMSIYLAALERHFQKFKDGEWADEKTGVPHLSSMLACIGIILDAKLVGKLTDDRPPVAPTANLIASLEAQVPRLKELFKDHHPHQHTIMDKKESA